MEQLILNLQNLLYLKQILEIDIAEMFNEAAQNYNIDNNSTKPGNGDVNYTSKESLEKICELYDRIIELEKSKKYNCFINLTSTSTRT